MPDQTDFVDNHYYKGYLVSHERCEGVPVLVSRPLELGGVCVPRALVLGLQVLHLGQNVEPVTHPEAGAVLSARRLSLQGLRGDRLFKQKLTTQAEQ